MELWCPFAIRKPVPGHEDGSGDFKGGQPKIVHHTTEGSSFVGAFGAYRATGGLPHFTDSYEGGVYTAWQHLPINVAASALKHPEHSGETNRDGHCIQIEHVGQAQFADHFADGYLDGMGRTCRWIEGQTGCPPVAPFPFLSNDSLRLTWRTWHNTAGHFGHQHVPFNDHWDPGRLNITRILGSASSPSLPVITPYPEDHMHRVDVEITNPPLDDNGNGWVKVPNTDAAKVVSVVAQGSYPPADGYWNLPVFGRQQRGPDTIIQVSEADKRAPARISVLVAD